MSPPQIRRHAPLLALAVVVATVGAPASAAAPLVRRSAQHAEVGVGVVAAPAPAASVAVGLAPGARWHGTVAYGDDAARVTLDHQWRIAPPFGRGRAWRLDFYGGAGLAGASDAAAPEREAFGLRVPAGVEIRFEVLHVEAFAEAAPTLGPLPRTELATELAGGLRAWF